MIDRSTSTTRPPEPAALDAGPAWAPLVLRVAAVYNVVWGAAAVLLPARFLGLFGVEGLTDIGLAFWQCIGMIVGVYGVGYWVAASDPRRHWPIVLVGLLGKVFGPIGFADAVFLKGLFPLSFGWTIVTNDLIWWVPFGLILLHAWKTRRRGTVRASDGHLEAHEVPV